MNKCLIEIRLKLTYGSLLFGVTLELRRTGGGGGLTVFTEDLLATREAP